MPLLHRYRLFISHAWKYNDEYNKIIQFLDAAPNFIYSNYSVPQHDPLDAGKTVKLKEGLRNQIRPVEIVIILAGMYVSYSDWIQFEIDFANSLNKPIIAVKPWGSERIPVAVQNSAKTIVGWNTTSIVEAIRKYS